MVKPVEVVGVGPPHVPNVSVIIGDIFIEVFEGIVFLETVHYVNSYKHIHDKINESSENCVHGLFCNWF